MANSKFTAQEFDEMIADLLSPNSSFVPLCDIAHKELWPKIYRTFQSSPALRQHYSDEDFMQDIFIKLINNVVTGFLLKDGPGGPVNRNYKGFRSWLHRVATNALYDLYSRINVKLKHAASDEIDEENLPLIEMEDPFYLEASVQELKNAFDIVITAKNTGIYKTLTWLIQSVLVLKFDFTRIEANKYLIAEFEQKTLWQMYEMLVEYADTLPWLALSDAHKKILEDALRDCEDGQSVSYGDMVYSDFFMTKGAKASVSDWVNRLDSKIRRYS